MFFGSLFAENNSQLLYAIVFCLDRLGFRIFILFENGVILVDFDILIILGNVRIFAGKIPGNFLVEVDKC